MLRFLSLILIVLTSLVGKAQVNKDAQNVNPITREEFSNYFNNSYTTVLPDSITTEVDQYYKSNEIDIRIALKYKALLKMIYNQNISVPIRIQISYKLLNEFTSAEFPAIFIQQQLKKLEE